MGELSLKMGDLSGKSVVKQYQDVVTQDASELTLFGPDSIIGRSIVIHKADSSRWVCAAIGEYTERFDSDCARTGLCKHHN
jgi:hypothetical protein